MEFGSLTALAIVEVIIVIGLCVAFGMRLRDPSKAPEETHTGTIDGLFMRVSGASVNGYPCMIVKCDDGKKRKLDLRSWAVYDDLWPGDRVQVVHHRWRADSVTVIARGPEYEEQSVSHTAQAVFANSSVKSRTYTRHVKRAVFALDNGETVTLRAPEDWTVPEPGTAGTLTWHGNRLDSFE